MSPTGNVNNNLPAGSLKIKQILITIVRPSKLIFDEKAFLTVLEEAFVTTIAEGSYPNSPTKLILQIVINQIVLYLF